MVTHIMGIQSWQSFSQSHTANPEQECFSSNDEYEMEISPSLESFFEDAECIAMLADH